MRKLLPLAALLTLAFAAPAGAQTPAVCEGATIERFLLDSGRVEADTFTFDGVEINSVRCADVTRDGHTDALFAISSGGTAGNTRWGVLAGAADGKPARVATLRSGYKVGVAIRGGRVEVLSPYYRSTDPNCCPSFFYIRPYSWTGTKFKAGKKRRVRRAPTRFFA